MYRPAIAVCYDDSDAHALPQWPEMQFNCMGFAGMMCVQFRHVHDMYPLLRFALITNALTLSAFVSGFCNMNKDVAHQHNKHEL